MPLSWKEIKSRALKFSQEWAGAHYEKGETQSFYNDFFDVFGISRRKVAFYEQALKKLNNTTGFIDLFWPGTLLVEQKSAGRSLEDARKQVFNDYLPGLNDKEFPRYILLSDFQNFDLLDLETGQAARFKLHELHDNVQHFAFVAGYKAQVYRDQDPVNIEASELMSNLHRQLEESGYEGHDLELLLVRLMFCLFADDTGIFEKDHFAYCLENYTKEDGSDLGGYLLTLFDVLNTAEEKRQKTLDEDLARFPYVNGELFAKPIRPVSFDKAMRFAMLRCCYFDWSKVSPALFGSLFQTVMLPEEQRKKGAHYTSEKNILKVIEPLFMDELRQEFKKIKSNRKRLEEFHAKLGKIRIMDPACGCGNFLILAYRELRELELEALKILHGDGTGKLDIRMFSTVDVDQFYGIELEEFPARIAETAMWLIDHQMNIRLSEAFGQYYVRLPLKKSAKIVHGNALTTDWKTVIEAEKLTYIISNPPFIGSTLMDETQRQEIENLFPGVKGAGTLDYVCGWYIKAAAYMKGTKIKAAFVSTNSITQGEQVGILWSELLNKAGIHIHFAHRTFKWTIDEKKAHGMRIAAVFVVIVGFANFKADQEILFEYETIVSDPHRVEVKHINPYLVDAPTILVRNRGEPLCNVPPMKFGSMPRDNGNLIFTEDELDDFLKADPVAKKWIRPYTGAYEFLNAGKRWCLWLLGADPTELKKHPKIIERIQKVRDFRLASKAASTRKFAETPAIFCQLAQPETDYLLVPRVSSERRNYIPIGFMDYSMIANDQVMTVENATLYNFAVMSSSMHMAWVRYVCGRLKSDYRYSKDIVYNNFPWPEPTAAQQKTIEDKAQAVLDVRGTFPGSSLADLYDPDVMPPTLRKAHQELDRAVDAAYRKAAFADDRARMEFLFDLYQKLTAPLALEDKKPKRRRKAS